jgi:hypothetical protein
MSVFESIKNAIFGHSASAAAPQKPAGPPPAAASVPRTAQPSSTVSNASAQPADRTPTQPPVQQPVDVEATLNGLAARNPQKLNWQQSIVDLMKLLGLDPSLHNRTELAKELGYRGDASDSAAMNVWLHQQVMNKLAESGGKVPDSLRS